MARDIRDVTLCAQCSAEGGDVSTSDNTTMMPPGRSICQKNLNPNSCAISSKAGSPIPRSGSNDLNVAPVSGMCIENPEAASRIQSVSSSKDVITPDPVAVNDPKVTLTPSFVSLFIHSLKKDRAALAASSEEIMFCSLVDRYGASMAVRVSKGFSWKCERPLHLLRSSDRAMITP